MHDIEKLILKYIFESPMGSCVASDIEDYSVPAVERMLEKMIDQDLVYFRGYGMTNEKVYKLTDKGFDTALSLS